MMDPATKYRCRCGAYRWLPERPLDPAPDPRAYCPRCDRKTTFAPVGTAHARHQ